MTETDIDRTVAHWASRYGSAELHLGALLCDRHDGDALRLLAGDRESRLSYAELAYRSKQFAGVLAELGIGKGDRVGVLLGRSEELLIATLGIWRVGAVHLPLFTAFGPDAVGYRLRTGLAKALVTDAGNRGKLEAREDVAHVVCFEPGAPGDVDAEAALAGATPVEDSVLTGDDPFVLLFTSGTTGGAKGVELPVRALGSIHSYMTFSLDVRSEDSYWNIADPGWGYGLWFAVIGPLLLGNTTTLSADPFDPQETVARLARLGITNLAGSPTAFRALRAAGVPEAVSRRLRLRAVSSAGEPLNPELLSWSTRALGVSIHDHYGQSEVGMPVGFHHHPALRRPPVAGSMGTSSPGFRVVVLSDAGEELGPDADGELAVDVERSPLYWFRGYDGRPDETAERFRHGSRYHLTGDTAAVDAAGLLRSAARADDVITSSGYRIGPADVENALVAHPAVVEAAVVGVPDALRGEAVTAFVVVSDRAAGDDELAVALQDHVRARLSKHLFPRHVVMVEALPRTPSGKVQRTVLRQQWATGAFATRVTPT